MEHHQILLYWPLIMLTARVCGELAIRMGIPAVLGELLAGVILGPSLLGVVPADEVINIMAEIGIILLLFEVGLETDVRRLVDAGNKALILATIGFVAPLILGYLLASQLFHLPLIASLMVGGALTATSIGITVRVLSDLNRQQSPEGQIVLGAAVIDDVLGVILLAVLYEFAVGDGISVVNIGRILLFIVAFFAIAPLAARGFAFLIQRAYRASHIPGLIPTSVVSLVLAFAWLANELGAPELLGGFAAGLALSRRFFLPFGISLHLQSEISEKVATEMKPILHLFTPIFFVYVGLSLNLREIDWDSSFIWLFSAAMLVVAIIGKMAGALPVKESWARRGILGIAMVPRGEVGLVFAELGRETEMINNEIYAGLLIVIAITTMMPPFIMKWWYSTFKATLTEEEQQEQQDEPQQLE